MNTDQRHAEFSMLCDRNWNMVVRDSGTATWRDHWFLDGGRATIRNTPDGMEFFAGPTFLDDSCHAVLWTQKEFAGDVKIEFDFTRLDREHRCVNILYIQATGSGEGPFARDISRWNHLREVPAMKEYFGHMFTYHVSFAAFNNDESRDPGYIRARRYMADQLEGTEIDPDYDPADLFDYGDPHHMTAIKSGDHIYFRIVNSRRDLLCHWHNTTLPPITEGRIGLRHMFTRAARYRNVEISVHGT